MSNVPMLPRAPGAHPGLQVRAGRSGSPSWRRRGALVAALLALAGLGALLATGAIGLPGAHPGTAPQQASGPGGPREAGPGRGRAKPGPVPSAPEARRTSDRVVPPTHVAALFARHSWYVAPPPKPAPPPPAPPPPTAPPFPYAFVGSFDQGGQPVYFLSRGDRVIDARVGDKLDGVYQFESAEGGQLVFVYLPLNVRQNLVARASR